MKKFRVGGFYGPAPLQGEWCVENEAAAEAIERAAKSPCALCGLPAAGAREIVPRKPKAFGAPDGFALYLGLCKAHLYHDAIDIEAHLIASRALAACERLGIVIDL